MSSVCAVRRQGHLERIQRFMGISNVNLTELFDSEQAGIRDQESHSRPQTFSWIRSVNVYVTLPKPYLSFWLLVSNFF
jgi:hypothetical protein